MAKIRVLIIDDSAYSRQTIKRILESDSRIEVAGIASDGVDAMAKTLRLAPDLITLDIEMPEMDGFSFLRWLMQHRPTPVIIISSYSDSKTVFRALEFGAADFVAKPSKILPREFEKLEKDLLSKVKGIKDFKLEKLNKNLELLREEEHRRESRQEISEEIQAVVIAASTGGPAALKIVLAKLPHDFPAAVAVIQHMPKGFTASFAERLNGISRISVREAEEGDMFEQGKVLICPGGYHMIFRKKGRRIIVGLKEPKVQDKYVPSADLTFTSVAELFGRHSLGVVLTGMGNDGTAGAVEIKKRGGYTIVESEETAVVNGMPSEVIRAGAAKYVLPISEIPFRVQEIVRGGRSD
jgi:two-component system, chemotaxis family, protein-glutamate methylesterase/glutaminase